MKIARSIVAVLVLLFYPSICPCVFALAKSPSAPQEFENSKGWSKIDLRFREAWRGAIAQGEVSEKFECILKISRTISEDDKAILKSAGFAPRTVIGAIVTGSVTARDLPAVANLDFVEVMELAAPLSPKKKNYRGLKK